MFTLDMPSLHVGTEMGLLDNADVKNVQLQFLKKMKLENNLMLKKQAILSSLPKRLVRLIPMLKKLIKLTAKKELKLLKLLHKLRLFLKRKKLLLL